MAVEHGAHSRPTLDEIVGLDAVDLGAISDFALVRRFVVHQHSVAQIGRWC